MPRLVPEEQLLTANALGGQVGDVARLAGSGLGGVIAAVGGITAVTLTDAASFIGSAALIALVRTSGSTAGGGSSRLAVIGDELREGLRVVTRDRLLRGLLLFGLVTSVGEGILAALFTPFVERVLHGSSQEFGLVVAAQAVGGIVGGLAAAPEPAVLGDQAVRLRIDRLRRRRPRDLPVPARVRRRLARRRRDDPGRGTRRAQFCRADDAVPAGQRGCLPRADVRRDRHRGGRRHAGRNPGRRLPQPAARDRAGYRRPGGRVRAGRARHAGLADSWTRDR